MSSVLFILLCLLIYCFYKYSIRNYNHWKKKRISYLKPTPFFGSFLDCILSRQQIGVYLSRLYHQFSNTPYFGIFFFNKPYLVIRDLELLKSVLVTDFKDFTDRTFFCDEKIDPLTANVLAHLKHAKWKRMRSKMSPVFSIAKIKGMLDLVVEVADEMVAHIENKIDTIGIDVKELGHKFSTDVIATCAFGIKAHCFSNENSEFRKVGKLLFEPNLKNSIVQASYFFAPGIIKTFKIPFFDKNATEFIRNMFWSTNEIRKKTNVKRNDVIDALNEIRKKKDVENDFELDGDKLVAQVLLFYAAGFETTGTTIGFALYELSLNPEIQHKLREELNTVLLEHKTLTYEALQDLKYMKMVLFETLRKYPVVPFLDRVAVQDYVLPYGNAIVEKGTSVIVPVTALHWDADYYPNPELFDPERFSDSVEEPVFYSPFGLGPKTCLGMQFAIMEMKVALAKVLGKFEWESTIDTPKQIDLSAKCFVLSSKSAIPIKFRKIA